MFKMPTATGAADDTLLDIWVSKYSLDTCGDYFYTGTYDANTGSFTPGEWNLR